jgi:hypothetical protein
MSSFPFPAGQPGRMPQVYVWEVLASANRETFWPRNSKHYNSGAIVPKYCKQIIARPANTDGV